MAPKLHSSGRESLSQQRGRNKAKLQWKGNMIQFGPGAKREGSCVGTEEGTSPAFRPRWKLGARFPSFRDTAEGGGHISCGLSSG